MDYYAISSERYSCVQQPGPYDAASQYSQTYPQNVSDGGLPPFYPGAPSYYSPPEAFPQYTAHPAYDQLYATYVSSPMSEYTMQSQYPQEEDGPMPIHAPVPVSPYSTLLPEHPQMAYSTSHGTQSPTEPSSIQTVAAYTAPQPSSLPSNLPVQPVALDKSPLDQFIHAPQEMFPTPCDLLNDLAARDRTMQSGLPAPQLSMPPLPLPQVEQKSKPNKKKQAAAEKPENQRKAYFRGVAENVGFQPTDPDTITSHEKKRHYLECLEHYVLWLHEQLRLVGKEPVELERVSTYRGLNSRSIRTLLVHMQDETKKMNDHIVEQEHRFLDLQDQVIASQVPADPQVLDLRRHSC